MENYGKKDLLLKLLFKTNCIQEAEWSSVCLKFKFFFQTVLKKDFLFRLFSRNIPTKREKLVMNEFDFVPLRYFYFTFFSQDPAHSSELLFENVADFCDKGGFNVVLKCFENPQIAMPLNVAGHLISLVGQVCYIFIILLNSLLLRHVFFSSLKMFCR